MIPEHLGKITGNSKRIVMAINTASIWRRLMTKVCAAIGALKSSLLYMLGLQAYFSTVKLSSTRLLLHYGYGYFLLRNSFAIKRAIRRYFVILTLFSKLWRYVIFERTECEP